jgi:hypothetical protein
MANLPSYSLFLVAAGTGIVCCRMSFMLGMIMMRFAGATTATVTTATTTTTTRATQCRYGPVDACSNDQQDYDSSEIHFISF